MVSYIDREATYILELKIMVFIVRRKVGWEFERKHQRFTQAWGRYAGAAEVPTRY